MKVMADHSDKRHSEFNAEEMSCKWGIGLGKKKTTLDVTTQMSVMLAIFSLIKRYWTYPLSQKLSRLRIKFYTDTLFSDDTSGRSNKCYQLYYDKDGFLRAFLIRSKSRIGDSLGNVFKDIGIMN